MFIFNNTSADFVLMSADVFLKMIIILSELKMNGLYSFLKNNSAQILIQSWVIFEKGGINSAGRKKKCHST